MATGTARRTTRKASTGKTTLIPPQRVDRSDAHKMAALYSDSEPKSPWQGFQNAGPDCYWEVPDTAVQRVN